MVAAVGSVGWIATAHMDENNHDPMDSENNEKNVIRDPSGAASFASSTEGSTRGSTHTTLERGTDNLWTALSLWNEPNRSYCIPFLSSFLFNKEEDQSSDPTLSSLQHSSSPRTALKKFRTIERLHGAATKTPLETKYVWHKDKILGKGSYGNVYLATSKTNGEKVALKQIPKQNTNSVSFQQEMRAMMYIKEKGGHPHLCSLHEHFDAPKDYYVVLDYIGGGEMFDHLIQNGAYSEMDAARLVREVASALNFLHGIGVVHADLKPENLLLTTSNRGDSVVKVVDFGCAQLLEHADDDDCATENWEPTYGAPTPAYCPAESINKTLPIQPSADMWALGVILFIMLTGAHPFDLTGDATDEEIEARIISPNYRIPIDSPRVTGHLSESAKTLIRRLMHPNPEKRLTALQMLQHPWVRGDTALRTKIAGSDARLSKVRRFKTKIQAKFFESAIKWSDDPHASGKASLIERSFRSIDTKEIMDEGGPIIDMSDFSHLLSDNIKHRHFQAGEVVYREGEKGDHMYFIDSGSVEVVTKDGSVAIRHPGDFFGEGALLHSQGLRSATIKCQTPVHALEISREYFEKYIAQSDSNLLATLKEKDKIRKRNRAKSILALQENMKTKRIGYRQKYFLEDDEDCDSLFILEQGKVDVSVGKHLVFVSYPGNIFGEYSVLTGLPRNCTATCVAKGGCVAQELPGEDFRKLASASPHIRETVRDIQLRREFKKAVVRRLNKEFPYQNPEEAFQAADLKETGHLDKESVAALMRELKKDYSDEDIRAMLETLDLTSSGKITYDQFKKIFIGDFRTSSSM